MSFMKVKGRWKKRPEIIFKLLEINIYLRTLAWLKWYRGYVGFILKLQTVVDAAWCTIKLRLALVTTSAFGSGPSWKTTTPTAEKTGI